MANSKEQLQSLYRHRQRIAQRIDLVEMIRGTLLERYLECSRPHCRCHQAKKYRHGPYYFLSIRRKDKSYHVYVPQQLKKKVQQWVTNYQHAWQGIEAITDLNVKLIRRHGK